MLTAVLTAGVTIMTVSVYTTGKRLQTTAQVCDARNDHVDLVHPAIVDIGQRRTRSAHGLHVDGMTL